MRDKILKLIEEYEKEEKEYKEDYKKYDERSSGAIASTYNQVIHDLKEIIEKDNDKLSTIKVRFNTKKIKNN